MFLASEKSRSYNNIMVVLDSSAFQHPGVSSSGPKMVSELLRLYCPPRLNGADGVHSRNSTKHDRNSSRAGLSDVALPALVQLGPFRVACSRAFVTLIHNGSAKVISQAVTCSPSPSRVGDIGMETLGLKTHGKWGHNESNGTTDGSRIVGDLTKEDQFKGHPFVLRFPETRFYAEIPLTSPRWGTFGTYCVVDEEDRVLLEDENITDLKDVADAIVQHLENVYTVHCQARPDRLLRTLMTVKGLPSVDDIEQQDSEPPAQAQSGLSEKMDHLSIVVKELHDIPPMSTRVHQPEFPFFQQHEQVFNLPPAREKHQEHLRRCSTASNHLVTVPEKVTPSPLSSLLFSRASSLLQSAMELDGALFLDASRSNSRRFSSTSGSDWDAQSKDGNGTISTHSSILSSHGGWSEKLCEPLGLSLSQSQKAGSSFKLVITEALLHDLFTWFPQGDIFYTDPSIQSPSVQPTYSDGSADEHEHPANFIAATRLARDFPDARSLIFYPLWNWDRSRWLAGIVIWTGDNERLLDEDDMYYLKTFADLVTAEYLQIGWTATEKSKSDLLSSVSHELRSPLHGMLASAELLQATTLESVQRDMVAMIETCGLTLLDTMNHLLGFTKINNLTNISRLQKDRTENQEVDVDHLVSEFDLGALVEEVADVLYSGHRSRINASKIAGRYLDSGTGVSSRTVSSESNQSDDSNDLSVVVRIEEQPSWVIQSVSGGLRRVVMNLIGNSFKFTQSGLIEVCLSQRVDRANGSKSVQAHLSIKDTGCGISPEFLEDKLFQPFMQENDLTEGVGLGLSIVRQTISYLGGTIDIRSEVGVGTQVDVFIPVELIQSPSDDLHSMLNSQSMKTTTRVCLIGLNGFAGLDGVPTQVLSTDAKRKLSIWGALSNVLLSHSGWAVSFADSIEKSAGDIGVMEESMLKKLSRNGDVHAHFKTVIILGQHGVSLPGNFAIKGADVIYLSQPIGPRKINDALRRYKVSHHESSPSTETPVSGPFPGIPTRGRSLSDAFALAKGTESPPVVKDSVSNYSPPSPRDTQGTDLHILLVDDNDINLKILSTFMRKIGCSFETANNGLAAFEKYKESSGNYDYVLMDISMPIMDGVVSTSKIREYEEQHSLPRVAIMAVTGVASSSMQQQAFAAGIDDYLKLQDLYSLALTTVSSLLRKHTIDPNTIGRLEVGTETLLDKSKSAKSVLMSLFPDNPDIEGIDTYNACYGGTSAVLNAVNWIESSSWDGRDAIVVAGDISLYDTPAARPTGGAGCVAMLIGADAPVMVEPVRASYMRHVYDFYKGDFGSEYPLVDGHFSNQCYMRALDGCYGGFREKVRRRSGYGEMDAHATDKRPQKEGEKEGGIDMFDFFIFHAPNSKMVAKAYGRLLFNDYRSNPGAFDTDSVPAEYATMDVDSSLTDKGVERLFMSLSKTKFTERVSPSLTIPANCGNSYTGSVWAGLASLLSNISSETLQNKRIGVYSYGAGLASTLLTLRVRGDIEDIAQKLNLHARLAARTEVTPEFYNEMCQLREQAYQAKNYPPRGSVEDLALGTYYLVHVDDQFRRQYEVKF
ncbi:uncharacterized protein KD926_010793 [Aspergillus affinis]|uniref:uncharacterized protein n=1 Tax=Aspergillus affinis TaxID=1070780 RepID=UPI0022FEB219|nr:uncharacterized protein KD926_010793 [Aspergillus affinis]KAI9038376.1 hypothetical protein KD926_010793 [Aspergillus affinis]